VRAKEEEEKELEDPLIEEVEEARIDLLTKGQSHTIIKRIIERLQDSKKGTIEIKEKIIKMKKIKNLFVLKRNLEIKKTVLVMVLEGKKKDFQVEIILGTNHLLLLNGFAHPTDLL
jgi:hypothetical protein